MFSLVVSIHGRPQASIASVFRQSIGYVFVKSTLNIFDYILNLLVPKGVLLDVSSLD